LLSSDTFFDSHSSPTDYLRTRPAVNAIQFTLSKEAIDEARAATSKSSKAKAAPAKLAAPPPSTPIKSAVNSLVTGVQKLNFSPSAINSPTPSHLASSDDDEDAPLKASTRQAPPPMAATVAASNGFSLLKKKQVEAEKKEEQQKEGGAEKEITFEEAKRAAAERAEGEFFCFDSSRAKLTTLTFVSSILLSFLTAALQCSIDNKDACLMCSGVRSNPSLRFRPSFVRSLTSLLFSFSPHSNPTSTHLSLDSSLLLDDSLFSFTFSRLVLFLFRPCIHPHLSLFLFF